MAKCFPEMIFFDKYEDSKSWKLLSHWEINPSWLEYKNKLYQIIKRDFIDNELYFRDKVIRLNFPDITGEFKHLTTRDSRFENNRIPDIERCMRLPWLRPSINNAYCLKDCCTRYIWDEKDNKKGGMVTLILYLEDRYLVILKEKNNYYYIKTAFYIEQDHELRKKIKNYYNFRFYNKCWGQGKEASTFFHLEA